MWIYLTLLEGPESSLFRDIGWMLPSLDETRGLGTHSVGLEYFEVCKGEEVSVKIKVKYVTKHRGRSIRHVKVGRRRTGVLTEQTRPWGPTSPRAWN